MKKLLLIFFCLLSALATFANTVDSLKTDSDVINFFNILIKKEFNGKLTKVDSWQKFDFNNDKNTDLLVQVLDNYHHPTYLIAIDIGNDQFQLIHLGLREDGKVVDIIKDNDVPLIVFSSSSYNYPKSYLSPKNKETHLDTLIYKFGGFVEVNREPSHNDIDSITFSTLWGWHGRENTPPKYVDKPDKMIVISHSGKAILTNNITLSYIVDKYHKPIRDPKTTAGVFKGKIKKATLEDIYNLINYLIIKKLNNRYAITWTDDVSFYLHIKFKDGSVKDIADYGGQGTWSLRNLFSKLSALSGNQDWK